MNKVILHQLPQTKTHEEIINQVRNNPLLIYDVLGYGPKDIEAHSLVFSFLSSLSIPTIYAKNLSIAQNIRKEQYIESDFFEYEGFIFPVIDIADFKSLSFNDRQIFVDKFLDSLSLSGIMPFQLVSWSILNVATLSVIEGADVIDSGLSDNGNIEEGKDVVGQISFDLLETDNEVFCTFSDDPELPTNILSELPESIVFNIETSDASLQFEFFHVDAIESSHDVEIDYEQHNLYTDDQNHYADNYDTDDIDNFDLI